MIYKDAKSNKKSIDQRYHENLYDYVIEETKIRKDIYIQITNMGITNTNYSYSLMNNTLSLNIINNNLLTIEEIAKIYRNVETVQTWRPLMVETINFPQEVQYYVDNTFNNMEKNKLGFSNEELKRYILNEMIDEIAEVKQEEQK